MWKQSGLREVGNLVAKKKIKKTFLKSAHRLDRLKRALEHKDWTIDDWKNVIWSDKTTDQITKICRFGSDEMEYAWVERESRSMNKIVKPTLKFGGGSIVIWGCMTWLGVGALIKIVGNMDATQYV